MHRNVSRTVGDAGRTPAGVTKSSNKVEGPRYTTVVENGKFDKTGVPRRSPPIGSDLEIMVLLSKGGGGVVHIYRGDIGDLEAMCLPCEQLDTVLHHP